MTTLYAWVTPAFVSESPLDHTWVTDYDNRVPDPYQNIGQVESNNANYWYCWGSFHIQGESSELPDGYLGSAVGDLSLATCLCLPNIPSADNTSPTPPNACGTIFHYGLDGVCHQLANQVLWATGSATSKPLTVALARGYFISSFIYGPYGILHSDWAANISRCTVATPSASPPGAATMDPNDDFAQHASHALAALNALDKLAPLLKLRQKMLEEQLTQRETLIKEERAASADELNKRNQGYLQRAAALLNDAEFKAVFGFAPGQAINLVDPAMMRHPPAGSSSR